MNLYLRNLSLTWQYSMYFGFLHTPYRSWTGRGTKKKQCRARVCVYLRYKSITSPPCTVRTRGWIVPAYDQDTQFGLPSNLLGTIFRDPISQRLSRITPRIVTIASTVDNKGRYCHHEWIDYLAQLFEPTTCKRHDRLLKRQLKMKGRIQLARWPVNALKPAHLSNDGMLMSRPMTLSGHVRLVLGIAVVHQIILAIASIQPIIFMFAIQVIKASWHRQGLLKGAVLDLEDGRS